MEQSSENERVSWRNMDCIQEVSLNGRLGSSLKPNKVRQVLETTHSFIANQKQMKNHFDYLMDKYQAWLSITKKTGNVYDPTTNTILMSNVEWDEALFDGTTATGVYGWSPSCTIPRPVTSSTSPNMETNAFAEESAPSNQNDDAVNTSPSKYSNPLGGQKKKRKLSSQQDIDDKMFVALDLLIKKNSGPEVEDCMEKLNGLGWEEPLYSATIGILCEGDSYRKAWMNMKDVNIMENWGAIGALDGTLVDAIIPLDKQNAYRGRGKGWEGVAHDSRVLKEIISNPNNCFPFPSPNKYYLCDAAYPCTRGFLPPYHNVRYWLGDYHRRRAVTKEERKERINDELFNHFDQPQVIFEED
ncbi:uncharacterized protein LOC133805863 [Humulus lupulus]|uniref:uncharacterized protein LOC133805863 n=1 Tax=Humulus lupulus TaxID=3486 RepID=UPI002B405C3F|nr:uncharacterized protein LOC133805863 [Humulus lupulus]